MGSYWSKVEKKSLILCGGGVCGMAHVAAYAAFESKGIVFTNFAGASIGSVIAAFASVRATSEQMKKFMDFDFRTLLDDDYGFVRDDYRLWYECGYYKGDVLQNKIEKFIFDLTGIGKLTFAKAHELFGTTLKMPVTHVWKSGCETKIYSWEETPDDVISSTCRMSCTYPGMFRSLGSTSDGGLFCNYPEHLFPAEGRVGILFEHKKNVEEKIPVSNIGEYLTSIVGDLHSKAQPVVNPLTTIVIPVNISSTNFKATTEELQTLYDNSYNSVLAKCV